MNIIHQLFKYDDNYKATIQLLDNRCANIFACEALDEEQLKRAFEEIVNNDIAVGSLIMNGNMLSILSDNVPIDLEQHCLLDKQVGTLWNAKIYIYPTVPDNIIYILAEEKYLFDDNFNDFHDNFNNNFNDNQLIMQETKKSNDKLINFISKIKNIIINLLKAKTQEQMTYDKLITHDNYIMSTDELINYIIQNHIYGDIIVNIPKKSIAKLVIEKVNY